jgi:hypothetical protein
MRTCHATLIVLAILGLAACDGGSECKRACRKMATCMGVNPDQGITYKESTSSATWSMSTDGGTTPKSSWTCSLTKECSPKEACYGKCIEQASCEALTQADVQGYLQLVACQSQCDQAKYDGGSDGAKVRRSRVDGCTPSCSGKECGDDGCGGMCGLCVWPKVCGASNSCVGGCTPSCGSKVCGSDGCGGSCGTCSTGSCNTSGQCVGTCTPSCGGKVCGGNGCGGSCGTCSTGSCNDAGQCTTTATGCGSITDIGCCSGTTLKYCSSGQLETLSCSSSPSCGWSTSGYYDCGTAGGSDTTGTYAKTCP